MPSSLVVLPGLGLLCGVVAVTSGGGASLGIPVMLLLGFAPVDAVANINAALMASFVTGSVAYGRTDHQLPRLPAYLWILAPIGSILGASLVIDIEPHALHLIIIGLLLVALVLTTLLKHGSRMTPLPESPLRRSIGSVVIVLLSVYSGFFGAGFGTFLILSLIHFYGLSYAQSASLGTRFSLFIVGVSALTFVLKGTVNFAIVLPLALGCAGGGLLGAKVAERVGSKPIRGLVIVMTALLILKLVLEDIIRG